MFPEIIPKHACANIHTQYIYRNFSETVFSLFIFHDYAAILSTVESGYAVDDPQICLERRYNFTIFKPIDNCGRCYVMLAFECDVRSFIYCRIRS